jgi:hypothetical protein
MTIETAVRARLEGLRQRGQTLRKTNGHGVALTQDHIAECAGWLTAVLHAVQSADGGATAYSDTARRIESERHAAAIPNAVGKLTDMLEYLLVDLDAGLLGSVIDHARAETFDSFLDHGQAYLKDGRAREAGVIVGVVFEDTVRRVCRKRSIDERDVNLDALISALVKQNVLTELKAKRARAAAGVRTKATHAQWDEFTVNDVEAALTFTRELIETQLGA